MNKLSVIKALKAGVIEAIDIIEFLQSRLVDLGVERDPIILHEIEKLEQLLAYAEHIHEENPTFKSTDYFN